MKKPQETMKQSDMGTLNENMRKKELMRIAVENQNLLNRLQNKKSGYDHKKMIRERQKNEYLITNICEYQPSCFGRRTNTTSNSNFSLQKINNSLSNNQVRSNKVIKTQQTHLRTYYDKPKSQQAYRITTKTENRKVTIYKRTHLFGNLQF